MTDKKPHCPLCGSEIESRVVEWDKMPTPQELVDAWESMGKPMVVAISSQLWVRAQDPDWNPESNPLLSPLFGDDPEAPEPSVADYVRPTLPKKVPWRSGGYWMAPGFSVEPLDLSGPEVVV